MAKADFRVPVQPALSELLALQIEVTVLKLQQLQTLGASLYAEQQRLVEQARTELGAPPGYVFNTDTRTFQPPAGKKETP